METSEFPTKLPKDPAKRLAVLDVLHQTIPKLIELRKKQVALQSELYQTIAYERQLLRLGINRSDIKQTLRGEMIARIDNCKLTHPVRMCPETTWKCELSGKRVPLDQEECKWCGQPLVTKMVRISEFDYRQRYADHIIGVITNDDKHHWFDELIPPRPKVK